MFLHNFNLSKDSFPNCTLGNLYYYNGAKKSFNVVSNEFIFFYLDAVVRTFENANRKEIKKIIMNKLRNAPGLLRKKQKDRSAVAEAVVPNMEENQMDGEEEEDAEPAVDDDDKDNDDGDGDSDDESTDNDC